MAIDRVGAFLREKTPRRIVAFVAFGAILFAFRELFLLFVFFVAFQRGLGAASEFLMRRAKCSRRVALASVIAATVGAIATAIVLGARSLARAATHAKETFPERIAEMKQSDLFQRVHEHLPGLDKVTEQAGHYATDVFHGLSLVGHAAAYLLIGFILAIVYLLEEVEIVEWKNSVDPRTLIGTLVHWAAYVADAISVTLQLQVIVAACNTALTLPVLFLLGIHHKIALMILIFASGLVPVIGNVVSGAVLSLLAYQVKGWLGVAIFVALTFVLHKLEAYYLNPHLTARHVKLPGFLLVVSLLAWEHLIGFAGLFLSFPFLYVAGKIRADFRLENVAENRTSEPPARPSQRPGSPKAEAAE